ncbi:TIGR03032 family protein (plasmid) [Leisingera caerulea]|uniref:TIGR03032 family protein n=1 Tax=Leisingera caerulea TaxID=506591 RepID=UPI0021A4BA7E|nr:TIGR03032 family protein [Leisingera caerulea]UWQ51874.1 TIGR03032 family protein [Leisingera caerulea]
MKLLLPLDSRIRNTQGFAVAGIEDGKFFLAETAEDLPYARKGFRGACMAGGRLCVCTSFSVKFYRVSQAPGGGYRFDLEQQVHRPEWLIGRGANADLHIPYEDPASGEIWVANSYMDCIDRLSADGAFLGRRFLWEISPEINELVRRRDPKAADLCHINFFSHICDEPVATLCNLNGSGQGAILSLNSGELWLRGLARPHDGLWHEGSFFVTETQRNRLLIYHDIARPADLARRQPQVIEFGAPEAWQDGVNRFWLRGLHVTDAWVFLGCSQFQDRATGEAGAVPSHIIVIDRRTGKIERRVPVPSCEALANPVIYNFLDMADVLTSSQACS